MPRDSSLEDDLTKFRSVEGERERDDSSDRDGDLCPMLMLCGECSVRLLGLERGLGLEKAQDGSMGYRCGFGADRSSSRGGTKCFGVFCSAVSTWSYPGHH